MSNEFKILETNPHIGLKNGIQQNTSELFRDSTLSNYLQIAIADVFSKACDKSLFSLDIEDLADTDELKRELSLSQFSFLQAFDYSGVHRALDLSEDVGGVAHYLAGRVNYVESIKIDPDRARLAANRCANKHNVCHVSEDLDKLNLPAQYYDLIVVGQIESLALEQAALPSFLADLQAALSPSGTLVINTLNANRLSRHYSSASQVSSLGIAYSDLYSSSDDGDRVTEMSRKQWRDVLLAANFSATDVHAGFSPDHQCRHLFSEDYLMASVNGLNHFYRLGSISNPDINEYLLYKRLVAEKQNLVDFANRYVILAGTRRDAVRALYDNDFSYFPGNTRKPEWRTITTRKRAATQVNKQRQYPSANSSSTLVAQNLTSQPFFKGRMLIDDWLQAMLKQDHRRFEKLVEEYADWLHEFSNKPTFCRTAYDLLPFNIVLNERGGKREYQLIDTEWEIKQSFSSDFVLFRALFWFAFENRALISAYANHNDLYSIGMFVVHYMPDVFQIEALRPFAELEETIQAEIDQGFRAGSVKNALLHSFDSNHRPLPPLKVDVVWGDAKGRMHEAQTRSVEWNKSAEPQTLQLALPTFDATQPILRIDPMSSAGAFQLSELTLLAEDGKTLWSLNSAAEILSFSKQSNLQVSGEILLALNDDPHLLFDLSDVANIDKATELALTLAWIWDPHYDDALDTLSQAVGQQNAAIIEQSHRLDQYRADIEYKEQRIEDLLGHRADLKRMFKDEEARTQRRQAEIDHLHERLHAQHVRNDELHGYLLMRPSTRLKRFARRTLNRLTGRTEPEVEPAPETTDAADDPSPLPPGELLGQNTEDYDLWMSENDMSDDDIAAAKAEIDAMPYKPVFSILVPIYNTDPEYLLPMIRSVQRQVYPHWQLCLVDDCSPKGYLREILKYEAAQDERISIRLNEVNQGISVTTNDALAMASGDYIALLDHDDEISINALYENARVINQHPEAGLIYSDEDKMDLEGNRLEPYFKPDYSPDLLHTNNYICHFTIIKKSIIDDIGGFREGLDGSQDHDIILRAADASERVIHIPKILYHWRKIPGSTAVVYDSKSYAWEAGRKAVEDLLKQHEEKVRVEFGTLKGTYRVRREIDGNPLVSIIIPFKDKPELLDTCLTSILDRSSYQNFEIIGVSNNSEEQQTLARMRHFEQADSRIRFVEKNIPFNFSALCNFGVAQAKGDYVVLLNNDIEIISPDWVEQMLEHAQRDEIGAVGCKLLYPDGRIQHAGVVAGMVGAAGHPHKFFPDNHIGYHGRLHMVYNVSAVTGAMMMMQTNKFHEVGGLDEDNLAVAYNDVDLCLKLLEQGYLNVFTPHAKATHHESISRGYEDTDEKVQRLLKEQRYFLDKWADFLKAGDPYYNPNLSLQNERFSLKFKD